MAIVRAIMRPLMRTLIRNTILEGVSIDPNAVTHLGIVVTNGGETVTHTE